MNMVILRGNVGSDPQIKTFEDGGKAARFSFATKERGYTKRDGTAVEDVTDWHNIEVRSSGLAEICEKYVKKGTSLLIVGKLRTRSYEDKDGVTRSITSVYADNIEMLTPKPQAEKPDADDLPW